MHVQEDTTGMGFTAIVCVCVCVRAHASKLLHAKHENY
jgi:hypothetical protein